MCIKESCGVYVCEVRVASEQTTSEASGEWASKRRLPRILGCWGKQPAQVSTF